MRADLSFREARNGVRLAQRILHSSDQKDLTSEEPVLQYREIPAKQCPSSAQGGNASGFMTSKPPLNIPNETSQQPCKHPRVQIVSREDDAEFVECLECGDIFESSEFEDMSIEERTQGGEL
jgi:hypothetical protein